LEVFDFYQDSCGAILPWDELNPSSPSERPDLARTQKQISYAR
jgi:hypothetical protein